ncbi:MAG TPA: acetylxylan esterase [Lacisediminihabitans sp.]|nr:acetylxylan esterase [Lacisediminihabitans sp.]HXD62744.1 acetylxylan esterase [Lacisediminihabitans sp.]
MLNDWPLDQLQQYRPEIAEPPGLSEFWERTLAETRAHDLNPRFERVDTGLTLVDTYDVTFAGYGGHPVRGWLRVPAGAQAALPTVVEYLGYGGGRGLAHEPVLWPLAGYAHLLMDTRGQGSVWKVGATPDAEPGSNPEQPGFMTRGILSPETYYYRRLMTDAVRAVEAAAAHPSVDRERIVVSGASQGGGLALAVSSLVPGLAGVMADVPFLSHFERAIVITDNNPYAEIARYLSIHRDRIEQVLATLSHFDVAGLVRRSSAPALFSVALMDTTCPASTVYAAYNNYAGPKEIRVYPFNNHEGGQLDQDREKLAWLRKVHSS